MCGQPYQGCKQKRVAGENTRVVVVGASYKKGVSVHARRIFTAAAAERTMLYGFYEPRLVQHWSVHRKQSAYLLRGSLILVQVKYKRDHRKSAANRLPTSGSSMVALELRCLRARR